MRILSVFKGTGKKDKYTKNIGFKIFIGIVVAYAALCFVGMFGFYFMQLAKNFVEQEVGFAYFSMAGCCYGCHWICNNGICCTVPDF